jgi:hypothetical protein
LTASARIDLSDARVGMKKRTLRSNQETDEGKRCAALANSLTKKAPYKGLGAESEEKHEPVSDIDTGVVDSSREFEQLREFAHSIGRTSLTAPANWRKASYRREETSRWGTRAPVFAVRETQKRRLAEPPY